MAFQIGVPPVFQLGQAAFQLRYGGVQVLRDVQVDLGDLDGANDTRGGLRWPKSSLPSPAGLGGGLGGPAGLRDPYGGPGDDAGSAFGPLRGFEGLEGLLG